MGIYQLCYLKMHSGMLFLAGHTEDKEKETLLKALSDVCLLYTSPSPRDS